MRCESLPLGGVIKRGVHLWFRCTLLVLQHVEHQYGGREKSETSETYFGYLGH